MKIYASTLLLLSRYLQHSLFFYLYGFTTKVVNFRSLGARKKGDKNFGNEICKKKKERKVEIGQGTFCWYCQIWFDSKSGSFWLFQILNYSMDTFSFASFKYLFFFYSYIVKSYFSSLSLNKWKFKPVVLNGGPPKTNANIFAAHHTSLKLFSVFQTIIWFEINSFCRFWMLLWLIRLTFCSFLYEICDLDSDVKNDKSLAAHKKSSVAHRLRNTGLNDGFAKQ